MHVASSEFLEAARPALLNGDAPLLASVVRGRWTQADLCRFLEDCDVNVRRVAAVALGMVGDQTCVSSLLRALRNADRHLNQMAEHGLWSIWFRSGSPEATEPFRRGVSLLASECFDKAILAFRTASRLDPMFAEAYNQCAVAHYLLGQYGESLRDCLKTARLVPMHFGAIAGMGHCYTQLGDLRRALHCYRRALRINPIMPGIALAIDQLEARTRDINEASGFFLTQEAGV